MIIKCSNLPTVNAKSYKVYQTTNYSGSLNYRKNKSEVTQLPVILMWKKKNCRFYRKIQLINTNRSLIRSKFKRKGGGEEKKFYKSRLDYDVRWLKK